MRIDIKLNFTEDEIFQYFKNNGYKDVPPYRKLTETEINQIGSGNKEYFDSKTKSIFESCVSKELGVYLKRMVLDPKGYDREKKINDIIN